MESQEQEEIRELIEFNIDSTWFVNQYNTLRERFKGNFVLIKNKSVLAAAPTIEQLQKEAKLDLAKNVVEFIPLKEVTFII